MPRWMPGSGRLDSPPHWRVRIVPRRRVTPLSNIHGNRDLARDACRIPVARQHLPGCGRVVVTVGFGWPRNSSAAARCTPASSASIAGASVCLESFSPVALVATGMCRYRGVGKSEALLQQDLARRGLQQVRAPHDVGDALVRIVDDHGELVGVQSVAALQRRSRRLRATSAMVPCTRSTNETIARTRSDRRPDRASRPRPRHVPGYDRALDSRQAPSRRFPCASNGSDRRNPARAGARAPLRTGACARFATRPRHRDRGRMRRAAGGSRRRRRAPCASRRRPPCARAIRRR